MNQSAYAIGQLAAVLLAVAIVTGFAWVMRLALPRLPWPGAILAGVIACAVGLVFAPNVGSWIILELGTIFGIWSAVKK